jgi:hypothetical protein
MCTVPLPPGVNPIAVKYIIICVMTRNMAGEGRYERLWKMHDLVAFCYSVGWWVDTSVSEKHKQE